MIEGEANYEEHFFHLFLCLPFFLKQIITETKSNNFFQTNVEISPR